MHPDLISLGFLHIKTYGAFMALGFLAAWQVLAWLCRRTGRNPEPCTNLIMLMMISGVVGARKLFAPDGTLVAELAAAGADGVRKYRNAIYGYEYEIREI